MSAGDDEDPPRTTPLRNISVPGLTLLPAGVIYASGEEMVADKAGMSV